MTAGADKIGFVANPEESVGLDEGKTSGWAGAMFRLSGIGKGGCAAGATEVAETVEGGGGGGICC